MIPGKHKDAYMVLGYACNHRCACCPCGKEQVQDAFLSREQIAGEIRRYLRDNSAIRVSRSIRDVAYKILQCTEGMLLKLGREPTLEEVARELELSVEEVSQALDAVCAPISLYDPVYADGGDPLTVMDQVKDNANTADHWLDQAAEQYTRLTPYLKAVSGQSVTAHTQLADGVYRTDFANGVWALVNYTDAVYAVDGAEIPAGGYLTGGY